MKVRNLLLFVVTLTLVIYGVSCTSPDESIPVTDYDSLINNLLAGGATVDQNGEIIQDFFSVPGKSIMVNGEDIQVFEYNNQSVAETEAALVSPDGSSIGTSLPFWIAPPHFYKAGRIIVLYIGENNEVIKILENVIGVQFAGK